MRVCLLRHTLVCTQPLPAPTAATTAAAEPGTESLQRVLWAWPVAAMTAEAVTTPTTWGDGGAHVVDVLKTDIRALQVRSLTDALCTHGLVHD
jgi:hypothetical protein